MTNMNNIPFLQLLEDPAFIPISHLETHMGQPRDFRHVLAAMMARETGSLKIDENAKRAISVHNSLVWRPTEYSHYFYTDIPGKRALLCKLRFICNETTNCDISVYPSQGCRLTGYSCFLYTNITGRSKKGFTTHRK